MLIIHVGKCAGGTIEKNLDDCSGIIIMHTHTSHRNIQVRKNLIQENKTILLLVRDPVTRFISIFYYWLQRKRFMNFFTVFKDANDLAEALTSDNNDIRNMAINALNTIVHFKQGFKYYLCDEETIINNINNFKFVIRQEYYSEDFKPVYDYLCKTGNINETTNINKFLKSKRNTTANYNSKKHLSQLAINNIKIFFSEDYDMLNILVKHNIISKEYLDSFINFAF
jgi:hypothetical protein